MERVYLDTNAFIQAFERPTPAQATLLRLFWLARRDRIGILTSRVTLSELLVKPLREGDDELIDLYGRLFGNGVLAVREVDADTLFDAARLRADNRRLKLFDAIHLATALAAQATVIVTRDTDFADVRAGAAFDRFGAGVAWPALCTPDSPTFAALVERHA